MTENALATETSTVRVRAMRRGDLDAVIEIDSAITGGRRSASWASDVSDYLSGGIVGSCRVAEIGNKVVGFLIGEIKGWEYGVPRGGWINVVGVHPDYTGMGIGRELISDFINRCHAAGVDRVYTLLQQGDQGTEAFFQACGFESSQLIAWTRPVTGKE